MSRKILWAALLAVPSAMLGYQQPLANAEEPGATATGRMNQSASTEQWAEHTPSQSQDQASDQQRSWNNGQQTDRQSESRDQAGQGQPGRDWQDEIRFGESTNNGLEITSVERDTPFYRGGLRQGDTIISYNGRQIHSQDDFGRWADNQSGQRIPVIVLRDGRRQTVYINYQNERGPGESYSNQPQQSAESQAFLGVRFDERNRGMVVISSVVSGSPADQAGLQQGDELISLNGREVDSPREVTRIVSGMQPGEKLEIEFGRRVRNHTQAVLEGRPGNFAAGQYRQGYDQYRQGPMQDEGVEQSSYNEETTTPTPTNGNTNGRIMERGSQRRGRILPRLWD
jgi:membrane-associated protease RseP (regulator of RpoE activity)